MTEENSERAVNAGLLVLRLGIGVIMILHGVPKLQAGPETWEKLGGAMGLFGIQFAPVFWGLMAALSEAVGGLFLALGLCVRISGAFMAFTMVVAVTMHIGKGDLFKGFSHPLSLLIVFLALVVSGGGRFSLGALIPFLKNRWFQ